MNVVIALALALAAAAAQRPAPDRPSERFAVLVYTSSLADARDETVPTAKVVDEVAKKIEDRKKWFVLVEDPDAADVLVEVVNHTRNERMRTRMETRVDFTGTRKEWVDVQWVQEQHFLEARVDLPVGAQVLVRGSDTREKGGHLDRAAEELAENLELLVKKRYWDLEAAR